MTISHDRFKITMKRVGPGTLFALFGAAVIGLSYSHPISYKTVLPEIRLSTDPKVGGHEISEGVPVEQYSGLGDSDGVALQREVKGLNLLLQYIGSTTGDYSVNNARLADLRKYQAALQSLRDNLISGYLGTGAVLLWHDKGDVFLRDQMSLSKEMREQLSLISRWYSTAPDSVAP